MPPRSEACKKSNKNKSSKPGGTKRARGSYKKRSKGGGLKNGLLDLPLEAGARAGEVGEGRLKARQMARLKMTGGRAAETWAKAPLLRRLHHLSQRPNMMVQMRAEAEVGDTEVEGAALEAPG
jgi:hypothetical protein